MIRSLTENHGVVYYVTCLLSVCIHALRAGAARCVDHDADVVALAVGQRRAAWNVVIETMSIDAPLIYVISAPWSCYQVRLLCCVIGSQYSHMHENELQAEAMHLALPLA